jgi:CRP-like cAMP-binding protein
MLASNRLFAGLAGATLQRIETLVRRQQAARGSTLFFQGDPGTVFYGIETGRVRMSAMSPEGREIHFVELGPGDTFGEIALLDGLVAEALGVEFAGEVGVVADGGPDGDHDLGVVVVDLADGTGGIGEAFLVPDHAAPLAVPLAA